LRAFGVLLVLLVALNAAVLATPFILLLYWRSFSTTSELSGFYGSLLLSLTTSAASSIMIFLIGAPVSYYISRKVSRRSLLMSVIMVPLAISPAAVGLLLLLFFAKTPLGQIINSYFSIVNDPKGIVAAQFFMGMPLGVSYFASLFSAVPRSYEDSALTMGFTRTEYFWRIMIPMLKYQTASGLILIFARVLGDFGASYIVGGGILGRTATLPVYLFLVNQLGETGVLVFVLSIYVASALGILILVHWLASMSGE